MIARLLLLTLAAAVAARPTRKDDPMSPDAWAKAGATHEGKAVRTAVLVIEEPGLVAGDAPAAAVRILGGNDKGEEGGPIVVLLPAARFGEFTSTYSQKDTGKGRSGFGAVAKSRVVEGVFVRIQGEPALLWQLPASAAQGLAKPSDLLAGQAALARGEQMKPARAGWTRRSFVVSRLDQRNQPETTRELQRLVDLENARAAKAKEPRTSVRELSQRTRDGDTVVVEDPKAKVEWRITWK